MEEHGLAVLVNGLVFSARDEYLLMAEIAVGMERRLWLVLHHYLRLVGTSNYTL